jgi:WD40 repeat protein
LVRINGEGARLISVLARHSDDVNSIAWLPDGERLITASDDSSALVWEPASGRLLDRFAAHDEHCMSVSASADGRVLSVGEDGTVFVGVLDVPSSRRSRSFACSIEGCSWSPDGQRAALACDDGVLRIVSPELDLLEEIPCASTAVRGVAWAADGTDRIVVGCYDASVRVLHGRSVEAEARGGAQWPRSVDTARGLVAVGSFGGSPVILSLDSLTTLNDGGPVTHGPNALAVAGRDLLVGLDSGSMLSLPVMSLKANAADGARLHVLSKSPILSLSHAPKGWLAGTYAGEVHRVAVGVDRSTLVGTVGLEAPVPSLATRRLEDRAAAGTYNGNIATLDLVRDGLRLVDKRQLHKSSIKSVAWVRDDVLVTGATDGAVKWSDDNGHTRDLWWHGNLVNAVAVDAWGVVASASRDRRVQLGVVSPSGEVRHRWDLLGADESVKAVAVLGSEGRAVVLAGSYDFAVYAWSVGLDPPIATDLRSGSVVHEFSQGVSAMCALDAWRVVAASWDGSIALIELDERGQPVVRSMVAINDVVAAAERFEVESQEVECVRA